MVYTVDKCHNISWAIIIYVTELSAISADLGHINNRGFSWDNVCLADVDNNGPSRCDAILVFEGTQWLLFLPTVSYQLTAEGRYYLPSVAQRGVNVYLNI